MSSASDIAAPPPPRPSVFISYASEDRAAARLLCDALSTAGLDVWYDESELGGGDAWDQKIRRQIRDCDYFMPVVSAATEARKEGYFRREWRLAVERTMDMADDVLFLLPVSIDSTSETGARVPDKFLHVQWLRFPGGRPTPALDAVVRRLLAGDHHALTRPPIAYSRPPTTTTSTPPAQPPLLPPTERRRDRESRHREPPPPMPPFPHAPEKGGFVDGLRFFAEAVWWVLTAAWLLLNRGPKWLRVVLSMWLFVTLLSRCGTSRINVGDDARPPRPPTTAEKNATEKAIKASVEKFIHAAGAEAATGKPADYAKLGAQIVRRIGATANGRDADGKRLAVLPFASGITDDTAAKFAGAVFTSAYGRLALSNPDEVGLSIEPVPDTTDAALVARGKKLDSEFILAAALGGPPAARELHLRLLEVETAQVKWTGSFSIAGSDPTVVAEKIADAVLAALPKK